MTVTPILTPPADLPPPHGPDHESCAPCEAHRRATGHVPLGESRSPFAEHMLAFWTDQAEKNRAVGFHDLARRCEFNASTWRFGGVIDWEREP